MRSRLHNGALAGILAIAVYGGAGGAAAEEPPRVREVLVENRGPGRVDESYVRGRIETASGQAYDRARVSRDVRTLVDSGWFTDVQAEARIESNDVTVVFGLVGRWRLAAPVVYEGREELSERKLRKQVELEPGDPVDEQVLGARASKVLAEYRKYDFYDATVVPELIPVDREAGTARAVMHIREGGEAPVKRVEFRGAQVIDRRELLDAVNYPNWWNPFRYFRSFDHEPEDLSAYRAAVRDAYLNRGYLDAAVSVPKVMTNAAGRAAIHIGVAEGEQYRLRAWSVGGETLFTAEELLRAVRLKAGAVASMRSIEAAAQAIKDRYSAAGYLGTTVRPRLEIDRAAHGVDVAFAVKEGSLTHLHLIHIVGNEKTKDEVLRRELKVYPGDLYDESRVDRSRRVLQNLGYFSRVDAYPQDTSVRDEKDLVIEVEEKSTGQFMIGAGFSSVDKLLGFIELSQGNFDLLGWPYFTGDGQKLKLRAEAGSSRSDYELQFTEPWFLDRPLSMGVDLFRRDHDYDDYDQTTTGFANTMGSRLPGAGNRIRVRYQLKRDEISDVSDTNVYTVVETGEDYSFALEQDTYDSSVRVTLDHNDRDRPFLPKSALSANVFGQVSGGVLGFDQDLYRSGMDLGWRVPTTPTHTITFKARYETVDAYGDTEDVDLANRLFLGGGRTLRGFEYRDVGPKAIRTDTDGTVHYKPIGGQSMVCASVEYAVELVRGVRLAAFYDTGNVWSDPYEIDVGDLASSWGVGVRFDLPGFPIRFDRAWVIDYDDEYTDDDPWVFYIGYDF